MTDYDYLLCPYFCDPFVSMFVDPFHCTWETIHFLFHDSESDNLSLDSLISVSRLFIQERERKKKERKEEREGGRKEEKKKELQREREKLERKLRKIFGEKGLKSCYINENSL